jgi:hypothetical protein
MRPPGRPSQGLLLTYRGLVEFRNPDKQCAAPCKAAAKTCKSFLVLFFKKEQERKHFFLKKEAKTFVHKSTLVTRGKLADKSSRK